MTDIRKIDEQLAELPVELLPWQKELIAQIIEGRATPTRMGAQPKVMLYDEPFEPASAEMSRYDNPQARQDMSLAQTAMTMEEKIEWCKLMSQGDMAPKQYQGKPSNVLFALEYAQAVKVPAIHALMSIAVINGKPSPSAELMVTLARQAGHKVWTEVADDRLSATTYVVRGDMPDKVFSDTFDKKLAQQAGLWGKQGPWTNYPDVMLANRSKSRAIRMACAEVLAGVTLSAEEQEDMIDGEIVDVAEEKPKQEKPKGLAAARKRTRKAPAKKAPAKEEPAPAPEMEEVPADPANLSEGAIAILADARKGDHGTRRDLWKAAANLDEAECQYVRAEIEAMNEEENNGNA